MSMSTTFTENVAAVILGLVILAIVIIIGLLAWDGTAIPDVLAVMFGTAGGSLASQINKK